MTACVIFAFCASNLILAAGERLRGHLAADSAGSGVAAIAGGSGVAFVAASGDAGDAEALCTALRRAMDTWTALQQSDRVSTDYLRTQINEMYAISFYLTWDICISESEGERRYTTWPDAGAHSIEEAIRAVSAYEASVAEYRTFLEASDELDPTRLGELANLAYSSVQALTMAEESVHPYPPLLNAVEKHIQHIKDRQARNTDYQRAILPLEHYQIIEDLLKPLHVEIARIGAQREFDPCSIGWIRHNVGKMMEFPNRLFPDWENDVKLIYQIIEATSNFFKFRSGENKLHYAKEATCEIYKYVKEALYAVELRVERRV